MRALLHCLLYGMEEKSAEMFIFVSVVVVYFFLWLPQDFLFVFGFWKSEYDMSRCGVCVHLAYLLFSKIFASWFGVYH